MVDVEREDITPDLVAGLVATQFPQWADLPVVPVTLNGWDNSTFRLGDELLVRLPSAEGYVEQVTKEHRWLPVLACHLAVRIPEPVAMARPGGEFPWPWSIYRWIEGQPATVDQIADLAKFASDLARFLVELHAIDARGGPPPGPHNSFRGGALDIYDLQMRQSIQFLGDEIDSAAVTELWDDATASARQRPAVWVHGDVAPSNLLVEDGQLRAVIDFGCVGVGDPACDLVIAWMFFTDESREVFRRDLAMDDATWARGRGWALWKALITLAEARLKGQEAHAAVRRYGWRIDARDVIDLVLSDHTRST